MTATFVNATKHSATMNPASKTASGTWDTLEMSGTGWAYNDQNLAYNSATDPDSGDSVYYNGVGTTVTWINATKH